MTRKPRLYYGRILKQTEYRPALRDDPARFFLQLVIDYEVTIYEADTPQGIIDQLKADGYQVWGDDVLDYTHPDTAWEYILFVDELKRRGNTDVEIAAFLRLDRGEGEAG